VQRVFPLCTSIGEKSWVKGCDPEFLYPADGETREGMVFRTSHNDEVTLWTCIEWNPSAYRVRYVRVAPSSRFGFVDVACRADHETQVTVTYTLTALSPAGESYLESLTEATFREMIESWKTAISRQLALTNASSSIQ
jgi:hypothetical protein